MNILVQGHDGVCFARVDTTVNRENEDFYAPEDVSSVDWTAVLFARVSKAGKAVRPEFASRYYDSIAFGVMMYPETDGVFSSCCDRTTLLPYPLYNSVTLQGEDNEFVLKINGEEAFRINAKGLEEKIVKALVKCSAHTSVRTGDFVAAELNMPELLARREDGECLVEASYCGNRTIECKVIF